MVTALVEIGARVVHNLAAEACLTTLGWGDGDGLQGVRLSSLVEAN
jgi:hypothetical protein